MTLKHLRKKPFFGLSRPFPGGLPTSVFSLLFLCAGQAQQATPFDFPRPVDTKPRAIQFQVKKTWAPGKDIFVSNQFAGARLNDFRQKDDSTFIVYIAPENRPINPSPWYAFKIWSAEPQVVRLEFQYSEAKHRYFPKVSRDGQNWAPMDSSLMVQADSMKAPVFRLSLSADTLWVAAQEIQNSRQVQDWCNTMAAHPDVQLREAGKSRLDRILPMIDIQVDSTPAKEMIVLFCRQHPPEVTGYLALQPFVETILENSPLANSFRRKYRVLVFPILNPDGVDLGHWRHNAGGVDLNRDWAYYHQPETRQIADYVVRTTAESKQQVILGMDFHSTWNDIYYTSVDTNCCIPGFKDFWLQALRESLTGYQPVEEASEISQPISKSWFFTQFGAEGITFEIGDDTPRDFIRKKGRQAAIEMMQLLVLRQ